jgi:hypothetical protein
MSDQCRFCRKPTAKAQFGRLWPWGEGEWRCVRCLRCEEEDAWRERKRGRGEDVFPLRRDPWSDEWLASPELYCLLRQKAATHPYRQLLARFLGGELCAYSQTGMADVHAWVSAGGVIVAYASGWAEADRPEWDALVNHLLNSEPLELGHTRDGSSYGALAPPHPTALPILKWGQTGDWMGLLAGTMWHGEDY